MITGLHQVAVIRRAAQRRVRRGDQARQGGDWPRAAGHYKAALSLNPTLTPIWVQYGHALKESGKWKAAELAYRKALAKDAGNADTHLQLGHALKLQGRRGEAAVHYLIAQFLAPDLEAARHEVSELGYSVIDAATRRHFEEVEAEIREKLEIELYGLRADLQRAINDSGLLRARLRDAEAPREASDPALLEAQKELTDRRRQAEKLELELYGLRSDLQRATNHSAILGTRLREAEETIAGHRWAQQEAEAALQSVTAELDAAARERAALLRESQPLRAALADAEENAEAARAAHAASEAALAAVQAGLTARQVQIEQVERALAAAEQAAQEAGDASAAERQASAAELDARQARIDELQSELVAAQQGLLEAHEAEAAQRVRIDELQSELVAAQQGLVEAREAAAGEREAVAAQIEQVERDLAAAEQVRKQESEAAARERQAIAAELTSVFAAELVSRQERIEAVEQERTALAAHTEQLQTDITTTQLVLAQTELKLAQRNALSQLAEAKRAAAEQAAREHFDAATRQHRTLAEQIENLKTDLLRSQPSPNLGETALPRIGSPAEFAEFFSTRLTSPAAIEDVPNTDSDYLPFDAVLDKRDLDRHRAAYLSFFMTRHSDLYRVYSRLADEASRSLFLRLILFRMLGSRHVMLPTNTPKFWAAKANLERLPSEEPKAPGSPLGFRHFQLEFTGPKTLLDCYKYNVFFTHFVRQYYLKRGNTIIEPKLGDVVVDAGSCFADTALKFGATVGPKGHVYSFEVLKPHLEISRFNMAQNPEIDNITLLPFALADRDQEGTNPDGKVNPGFSLNGDGMAPTRCLDSLIEEQTIRKVDFIKMDIEGSELAALRGAEQTLRRFRPKLAISIYHRWDDYITIPEFVDSLDLGYSLFLDNYTISDGETILYAAPSTDA